MVEEELGQSPNEVFASIIKEIVDLQSKKDVDYKCLWKLVGIEDINTDIKRKFLRLWVNKNKVSGMNFESLYDTYIDLAVYAIFGAAKIKKGWTKDEIEKVIL